MLALLAVTLLNPLQTSGVSISATPQVTLTFLGANPVTVTGPANTAQNAEYPWKLEQTLYAPGGLAAAVRFCWEAVKYHGCQTQLGLPGRAPAVLDKGNVEQLLWTPDGQYLIGAGRNTIRLWNLSGAVRTATPQIELPEANGRFQSVISELRLDGKNLCVMTDDYGPLDQRGVWQRLSSASVYALPALRQRITISMPVGTKPECHSYPPSV